MLFRSIVNNESSEIIRMFNDAFGAVTGPTHDYYPEPLRGEIDAMNALVLKGINNAVNGCGRSSSQAAYEESFHLLFRTLDDLDLLVPMAERRLMRVFVSVTTLDDELKRRMEPRASGPAARLQHARPVTSDRFSWATCCRS